MEIFDLKIIITIITIIVTAIIIVPYIKDIFGGKTKPHVYTWLIWSIAQAIAFAGMIYGGAGMGAIPMGIFASLTLFIFILSLKFGSNDIVLYDKVILFLAILAIFVWVQLDSPVWAVIMVSFIDILGYIPTLRKSYSKPWEETLFFWLGNVVANFLTLILIAEYNLLTTTYITSIFVANITLSLLLIVRRKTLKQ